MITYFHLLSQTRRCIPYTKNDSHFILVDYGDDQFTLCIQDKGNIVEYTPLDSFVFQSVSSFLNKYKKPIKNKGKTLLQENPLLNETDLYETDDPVIKRIPTQDSQKSHELHILLTEMQYHNFNDNHLSQDILTNITISSSNVTNTTNINAITQTLLNLHLLNLCHSVTHPFLPNVKHLRISSSLRILF